MVLVTCAGGLVVSVPDMLRNVCCSCAFGMVAMTVGTVDALWTVWGHASRVGGESWELSVMLKCERRAS